MVTQPNKCPNCHFQISDKNTDSGITQKRAPDAPAPKTNTPGTNVVLNEVLFDSRTRRFIIAKSEDPDPGFMEMRDDRRRFFPNEKDLPRTDENLPGREFKQMIAPNPVANCDFDTQGMPMKPMQAPSPDATDRKRKVDNVSKSCMDLAIDG